MVLIVVDPLSNRRQNRKFRWELERRRLLASFPHVFKKSARTVQRLKGTVGGREKLGRRVFAVRELDEV